MIRAHTLDHQEIRSLEPELGAERLPDGCVWLDLLSPRKDEETAAETWIGLNLPTWEEMREIEASSRLYAADGAHFMTATLVTKADTASPAASVVTFVLTETVLVTIRYGESTAFQVFQQSLARQPHLLENPCTALAGLLDAAIDRLADILERIQADLDQASGAIFNEDSAVRGSEFHRMLGRIGRNGDLVSKVRESLVSFGRLDGFARRIDRVEKDKTTLNQLKTLSEDIQSLTDHASFLNTKVDFLLNAILGKINIEQNATIKMFSVVAVVFMPPTLLASIYGMNFRYMPELAWPLSYPLALVAMVVAAILPYLIFKRRGWI